MISVDIDGHRFNYCVRAVCIQDGQILLNRFNDADWWFLPGGRVDAGEDSVTALIREITEELELPARVGRLIWVMESLFEHQERKFHEIGFYFLTELPLKPQPEPFPSPEGLLTFEWFALERIPQINLMPPIIRKELFGIPGAPKHILDLQR